MKSEPAIEAALFPIPGMVAFPGTLAPLHVFEPRYRAMIKHCLEHDLLLAVSHTKKAIEGSAGNQQRAKSTADLNSNLQSYESHEVFSAGPCQLLETTADGRLHVAVQFTQRLRKLATVQQVPFQIVRCEAVNDQLPALNDTELAALLADCQSMVARISEHANAELHAIVMADAWQQLSAEAFSYQVFTYFKFEPDFMQSVLEIDQVDQRLVMIKAGLSRAL
ncbi:LON peptidase substrate-binding domain-containing protein [Marinicella meishanensis]|uniref:LON peptidase substrate-binding domain-containing protein n=1 Tax=Marinicella meishanensis TaxID=2873263 RepID=UPI001CBD18B5|nr:LON peptidase substrate-binding domain-containing protein [Marinicella sp. NBU2979]